MLELDETLFVEHKSDLRSGSVYGLVSAVASFANTLGGWLLVRVHGGKPVADPGVWAGPEGLALVDAVRDLLRMELDPLPAFEARVMPHPDGPVGVVRVYESSDTPHVSMRNGSVFVREVAGKSDVCENKRPGSGARGQRAYRAAQIRSRGQPLELAERGRRARERVAELTDPLRPLPFGRGRAGSALRAHRRRQRPAAPATEARLWCAWAPTRCRPASSVGPPPPRTRRRCWPPPSSCLTSTGCPTAGSRPIPPVPRWPSTSRQARGITMP
jgi:hypothetical protein